MRRWLDNIEEIVASLMLGALCLIVVWGVLCRYIMAHPPFWTEEASTILFVWITMLGSSSALKRGEHFAVELLRPRLSGNQHRLLQMLVALAVACFAAMLLFHGCRFAWRNHHVLTPAMELPRSIPFAAIPVGGALMMIRSFQNLIRLSAQREAGT